MKKRTLSKINMKSLILLGGTIFSFFNLLPLPWSLRILWLKFLFFLTAKGTLIFPSILRFVEKQNTTYKMGKQEGEGYESMVQLEKILEYIESKEIAIQHMREAVERAERQNIPAEQLGAFIAHQVLDPHSAEQVITESLRGVRY